MKVNGGTWCKRGIMFPLQKLGKQNNFDIIKYCWEQENHKAETEQQKSTEDTYAWEEYLRIKDMYAVMGFCQNKIASV